MKDEEGKLSKEVRARAVVAEGNLKQKKGHRPKLGGVVYHSLSWVENQEQVGWLQPEVQGSEWQEMSEESLALRLEERWGQKSSGREEGRETEGKLKCFLGEKLGMVWGLEKDGRTGVGRSKEIGRKR